jgi:nucleotide-binding universal stress UspA family protein
MFSNILIGVDGRQGGRDAVSLALQLAAPKAVFTLTHVYGGDCLVGRGAALALAAERRASDELLAEERRRSGIDAEVMSCGELSVARGLHLIARRTEADLLVVGSSRRGAIGRVLRGDDASEAQGGAPCALAVSPRGHEDAPGELLQIGVGYNATPESESALSAARELAAHRGVRISALWVVSRDDAEAHSPLPTDWSESTKQIVEERQELLRSRPGIDGSVVCGPPREELIRFGQELDLLILGSRGYGRVGRLVHGSVSSYLTRHAPCPLLVLPRGSRASAALPASDRAVRQPA